MVSLGFIRFFRKNILGITVSIEGSNIQKDEVYK
jgi:hypothetical protein